MGKEIDRSGFTLVELMTVIMIVAILVSVAVPLMRGRIDAAKWSEGKAIMGTVATALRAYGAEKGDDGNWSPTQVDLGFVAGDLTGTYFPAGAITWTANYDSTATPSLTFLITGTHATLDPAKITLDNTGAWVETPK